MQTQTLVISIDNSIDTRRLNTKFRVFKSEMLGLKPGVSLYIASPRGLRRTSLYAALRAIDTMHRCSNLFQTNLSNPGSNSIFNDA